MTIPASCGLAMAAVLGAACAGGGTHKAAPAGIRTDSVKQAEPAADLAGFLADQLDPQAVCLWKAAEDLDLDGRADSVFLFRKPDDRVAPGGNPCFQTALAIVLRKEDGAFDASEAVVATMPRRTFACRDSQSVDRPRLEIHPGTIAIAVPIAGRDSMERQLEFAWSDDQATWVLARARERWKLPVGKDAPARWLDHEMAPPPDLALGAFDDSAFCPGRCLVEAGWRLFAAAVSDLDGDGAKEVVFATETTDTTLEKADLTFADGSRSLGIARILPSGGLRSEGINSHAIGCARCGGALGDPFSGLQVGKGWFSLEDVSGAAQKLSRRQVFRWSKVDRNWFLAEASTRVLLFHKDGVDDPPVVRTPKDFGKIPWTAYDADDFIRRFEE